MGTTGLLIRVVLLFMAAVTSLSDAAHGQAPLFEVENADQLKILQVTDQAGFVVRGTGTSDVGIPASGPGSRLMWHPGKRAFRAGQVGGGEWDDGNIGIFSVALGQNTSASQRHSFAMGQSSTASGIASVAIGNGVIASGSQSAAMGDATAATGANSLAAGHGTVASGPASTALGYSTVASAEGSTALGTQSQAGGGNSLAVGYRTQASGNASTAMGTGTIAAGAAAVAMGSAVTAQGDGSFIFGDRSTSFPLSAAANTFMVRAFGGIGFNTGVSIGCDLPTGTGAWACTSSRLAKEGFEDVDGEVVLAKLAAMPIERWRYLNTDATHLGPTAEDFRAAFGLGESSTKIAAVDADGVALKAVQALERRTVELREENAALRTELAMLRDANGVLQAKIERVLDHCSAHDPTSRASTTHESSHDGPWPP